MPTLEEKAAFAERLLLSMRRAREKPVGATALARGFNCRWTGEPVSAQTAHKWITGRTIPTRDKLEVMAKWLQVELHWLHYGVGGTLEPVPAPQRISRYQLSDETFEVAMKLEALDAHCRYLVRAIVAELYGDPLRS